MDLQDSVQRSLQTPAEKIMQICTDSQRSKTWVPVLTTQGNPSVAIGGPPMAIGGGKLANVEAFPSVVHQ